LWRRRFGVRCTSRMAIIEWLGGVDKRICRRPPAPEITLAAKVALRAATVGMQLDRRGDYIGREFRLIASGGAKWLKRCMRRAPIEFFAPALRGRTPPFIRPRKKMELAPFGNGESRCAQARICIF
jgi:hypothetical protein